jgi:hypothetical protein
VQQLGHGAPRLISWRRGALLPATLLLGITIGIPFVARRPASAKQHPQDYALVNWPVIQRPTALPAEQVALADDTVVIGVEAGGRWRAYVLQAFYRPGRHVINDLLGGKPITVTYCDMTDCLAVFTEPDATEPLDVAAGGWQGQFERGKPLGTMLLRVGSTWYRQDSGQPLADNGDNPFPYTKTDFMRTTWKDWFDEHPDTDVYVGEISSERANPVGQATIAKPAQ